MSDIREFLDSKPRLGEKVFVAETAYIVGRLDIEDHASIWPGVSARADVNAIRVGKRTNIQDNTVLHVDHDAPLEIGDDVTVGHACVLHGCTVKDRCLIGMGSVILNGAVVGPDAIIGAGTVVRQGQVVPPGSLFLGVPGAVKRNLTPEEIASIVQSAKAYSEYALAYLERQHK